MEVANFCLDLSNVRLTQSKSNLFLAIDTWLAEPNDRLDALELLFASQVGQQAAVVILILGCWLDFFGIEGGALRLSNVVVLIV